MLELDPVRLQDAFEGNIDSFINWKLKVNFVCCLKFCLYSNLGFSDVNVANVDFSRLRRICC